MTMFSVAVASLAILFTTEAQSSVAANTGCLYFDITTMFSDCLRNQTDGNNLDELLQEILNSAEVNEEQFLNKLTSLCSNESVIDSYTMCADRSTADCPQLAFVVANTVNEDVAVFCENGAPSEWLSTVLQNEYKYTNQCIRYGDGIGMIGVARQCLDDADFPYNFSNMTVISAFLAIQRKVSQWVQCMVNRAPSLPDEDGDGVLECGSTWQDLVLTLALRVSAFDPLGVKIGPQEIFKLKAIKTGLALKK
ncbi:uncharacterized protein LOC123534292 [Mercenaria mercenaria]|uniref:uncharacterized protein LOC123534292 n=1 Tax=Mercenaria mercenaria TaxID=6596 RepID=UPI00234F94FB|nr:uncharacterized protein LOC123534292 [Mercenaria mercenaria]